MDTSSVACAAAEPPRERRPAPGELVSLWVMPRIHADPFVLLMGVLVNKLFNVVPAQAVVARWPGTFKELPPRQKPACFNIGAVMENLTAPQGPGK